MTVYFVFSLDDHSHKVWERFLKIHRKQSSKEAVDMAESTTYLTFGVPLEDCPASYENKVSVCVCVCVCVFRQYVLLSYATT